MYEKYTTALRLMDACVAVKDSPEPEGGWPLSELSYIYKGGNTHAGLHPCNTAWDECFRFIFANFAEPVRGSDETWRKHIDDVKMCLMVNRQELERLLHSMPPELAEQVFPVAIARYMLRDAGLPINHRLLKTFRQFHEWYCSLILA